MRRALKTGAGAVLVLLIMVVGSFGLWLGTPLAWLWIGSQIQGSTDSVGAALGVTFPGAVVTIVILASVLAKLSDIYRANRQARGLEDPGHLVLEGVLVISAAVTLAVFIIWFFFIAGANPVPLGINL
jgi:hypothetical protein